MKLFSLYTSVLISVSLISSCTINTDLMLKTDKEYEFAELTDSVLYSSTQYILAPNDIIKFKMFDNNGYVIISQGISSGLEGRDQAANNQMVALRETNVTYLVESDSTVKLPELGYIKLAGLTVRQVEDTLKKLYTPKYVKPFIQVQVTNKRVIVFPGSGGDAQVVRLVNNNTTLMEVLAAVGGIAQRGKAKHIKLMRNIEGKRYVYLIDLSTIEGLKYTDMLVRANDYIYVEPVPEIGREIIKDVAPIISIVSSVLLVYTVIRTLKN